MNATAILGSASLALAALGCSESATPPASDLDAGAPDAAVHLDIGKVIDVVVPDEGRVFVDLGAPAVVKPGDPATSVGWDLAFEGLDVFTNSGPSGPGRASGFGPFVGPVDVKTPPEVPFLQQDKTGGAFLDWYAYDGTTHQLWSRYHVVGVRSKDRLFKVQVLGYYGEREGAPLSGIYKLRYAEVTKDGVGETHDLDDVDGTAGGLSAPESTPSTCLALATGKRIQHEPDEARTTSDWDLCFRRENVGVDGGDGGPRGDGAVDLQGSKTAGEDLEDVKNETAASETARFDAVSFATLSDPKLTYRGDGVVSIFTDQWLVAGSSPPSPTYASWLVLGSDGKSNFLVVFESFEGATAKSPGTIHLRVVPYPT